MNNNRNLWAFNNCLVDLTTGIKRSIEPSDYISITCGYDYPELDVEEKTNALKYLKTMFRDEEELLFCLRCMASCLRGENYFNKLFTFIGGGGNGKGCFFDAFQQVFGKYWGVMPMEYWNSETSRDATRADVNAVSSLYKRVLYSVESDAPDDGEKQESKLCVSKIKKWTGGDIIKCRDNYSKSKEQIEFKAYGTILFNTNYPPAIPIKEKNSDAIKRRLIIHEFPFTFVDDIQSRQIEEGKTFKVGNPEIKKQLQSDKIKNALIHILLEIYNKDINGKSELELPESTKNSTKSFIGNEDKIVNDFMTETFERTSDDKDVVKREAIFMFFKDSDYYVKSITAMMFYNILERIKYNKSARNIIKIKYKKEEAKDKKEEDEDHNTSAI
jgi:phage/plasmid-associated DNA primase